MSLLMQSSHAGRVAPPVADVPRFLLIVREQLRPGAEDAYDENEVRLANACAELGCPHPYLAVAAGDAPAVVWWLNAFASDEERRNVEAAYARNERLMAALRPLAQRKQALRATFESTMAEYRPALSRGPTFRIAGSRYFKIWTSLSEAAHGAVFQGPAQKHFVIQSFSDRPVEQARTQHDAATLTVQPRWSFPAPSWIASDPEFWSARGQ
jgi:hypothetical protein